MKTKRLLWFFTVAALAGFSMTALGSCFSPWSGDPGTITIDFGDPDEHDNAAGSAHARSAVTPDEVPTLTHIITLTGPGATVTERLIGAGTVSINLPAGRWYIRVRAESPEPALTLRALGFGRVQVVARHSTPATIDMISATEVANYFQLSAAINTARDDGLEKIIMITQDIEAASQLTIGSGRNITFASETYNVAITRGAGLLPNDAIFIEQGNGTFRVDREEFAGSVYIQRPGTVMGPPPENEGAPGTATNPFRITTAEQLSMIGSGTGYYSDWSLNASYVLTADITAGTWTPIGSVAEPFTGNFDGVGFTISGLTITGNNNEQGLFGVIGEGGVVRNLNLTNVNISGASHVGSLVGRNYGLVDRVHAAGSVTGSGSVGGIAGINTGGSAVISNSRSDVNVVLTATNNAGGIVGANHSTIRNSFSTGNVTNTSTGGWTGGIVGQGAGSSNVINNFSTGNINSNGNTVGGILGGGAIGATGSVRNNFSTGTISGVDNVGGILGNVTSGTVRDNVALNLGVTGTGANVGRITGTTNGTRINNHARSNMTLTANPARDPEPNINARDGADVTLAATQTQAWWESIGFAFGTSDDAPWQWDTNSLHPRFWWDN